MSESTSLPTAETDDQTPTAESGAANEALLEAPEHVLSTLERDGSRRWLHPRLSQGIWWKRRRVVAYVLIAIFVAIPHLRFAGKPLVLIDIAAREFTILGKTFLATDTLLLALLMLSVFVSIVLVTAIAGRAWCGWACPQTVYMEFLFRPIDRLFEGTKGKGGKPRREMTLLMHAARFALYVVLCMFLSHTFLAYFVGTERLGEWIQSSPIEHPVAFFVMAGTLGLMIFDFMFFREQLCLIACPYGRFQSVMLDQQSMIVGYDETRGEPRKKGKHTEGDGAGDCVDCNQCVVVCPTGIDIRNGLQMECINCTQCIDACDDVMERVGSPKGLIRYSSQDSLAGKAKQLLRARTVIYPLILVGLFSGLLFAIWAKSSFDVRVIRGKGAPFTLFENRRVSNEFQLRLVNRVSEPRTFEILPAEGSDVEIEVLDLEKLTIAGGESVLVPLHVSFPIGMTRGDGREVVSAIVQNDDDQKREIEFSLLGPR